MAKTTVSVRAADNSVRNIGGESLPGAVHLIQFVATAIPNVVDWQELTVGTTAQTLAALCSGGALPANATHALFRVYSGGGDIRWTDDVGAATPTDPTATLGFPAAACEWGECVSLATI